MIDSEERAAAPWRAPVKNRRATAKLPVHRADNPEHIRSRDVSVNHGRADIGMPQKGLNRPNVVSDLEKVGGEAVPQRMD